MEEWPSWPRILRKEREDMKIFVSTTLATLILVATLCLEPKNLEPTLAVQQTTDQVATGQNEATTEVVPTTEPETTTLPTTETTTIPETLTPTTTTRPETQKATEPPTTKRETTTHPPTTTAKPTTEVETTTEAKTTTKAETKTKSYGVKAQSVDKKKEDAVGSKIGNFRITGYTAEEGFVYGATTASGMGCRPGICAMNNSRRKELGIEYGDKIYVEGLGTYVVADCGCSYNTVDI